METRHWSARLLGVGEVAADGFADDLGSGDVAPTGGDVEFDQVRGPDGDVDAAREGRRHRGRITRVVSRVVFVSRTGVTRSHGWGERGVGRHIGGRTPAFRGVSCHRARLVGAGELVSSTDTTLRRVVSVLCVSCVDTCVTALGMTRPIECPVLPIRVAPLPSPYVVIATTIRHKPWSEACAMGRKSQIAVQHWTQQLCRRDDGRRQDSYPRQTRGHTTWDTR